MRKESSKAASSKLLFLHSFLSLAAYVHGALEYVTISSDLDSVGHTCVSKCLYSVYRTDMGQAMGCATPYDNNCYCATASASATKADEFMSKCASSSCAVGDLSRDLKDMQSIYGSYCMNAGFTQPGATNWYSPAEATDAKATSDEERPSQTSGSGPETTTQWTVVTQTTEGGGAKITESRVIVQATSTLWVNPDGSPASLGSSNNGGDDTAIKIGVGVGVPVVVLAALGTFLWWFLRRRRQQRNQLAQPPAEYAAQGDISTRPPPPMSSASPISRKPVASPAVSSITATNELSGNEVRRELSGREANPVSPSSPVAAAGQHEVHGEGWRPEMDGQGRWAEFPGEGRPPELAGQGQSPPPQYGAYQHHQSQEQTTTTQRWELPGSS